MKPSHSATGPDGANSAFDVQRLCWIDIARNQKGDSLDFTNRTLTHGGCVQTGAIPPSPTREMWRPCAVAGGALLLIVMATGCARRIPEPAVGHTDSPHLGWVIMSGDAGNPDRDFVCQSDPRTECVVPVDRPDTRVLGHVHVYYHAASTETKYTGAVRIGFFDQPHEINPSITVKPGESPGNQSVSGFVSAKPGPYAMSIAVVATSTQTRQTQDIRDDVSVIVK
jgi:hypothetical protein